MNRFPDVIQNKKYVIRLLNEEDGLLPEFVNLPTFLYATILEKFNQSIKIKTYNNLSLTIPYNQIESIHSLEAWFAFQMPAADAQNVPANPDEAAAAFEAAVLAARVAANEALGAAVAVGEAEAVNLKLHAVAAAAEKAAEEAMQFKAWAGIEAAWKFRHFMLQIVTERARERAQLARNVLAGGKRKSRKSRRKAHRKSHRKSHRKAYRKSRRSCRK